MSNIVEALRSLLHDTSRMVAQDLNGTLSRGPSARTANGTLVGVEYHPGGSRAAWDVANYQPDPMPNCHGEYINRRYGDSGSYV